MNRSTLPLPGATHRAALLVLGFLCGAGTALRADTLLSTTNYNYSGSSATYTVPANTNYVVVKAWGAGGGRGVGDNGGGGGFVTATFAASSGETFTVKVGGGGNYGSATWPAPSGGGWNGGGNSCDVGGSGGGYSSVAASSWAVYAGGGGGAGWGAAGAPGGNHSTTGLHGGDTAAAQGGGTATYAGGGYGGAGFPDFGENGTGGSQYQGGQGGADNGPSSWYVDLAACGGGGGGGYYGGGGGGTGDRSSFGGGGGGGSSHVTGSPINSSYTMGSGATPGGTGDASYPGGGKGYGSSSNFTAGGNGYVVVLAYQTDAAPTITSGSVDLAQNQSVDYAISASASPAVSSYGATGLPAGLSLDTSTGHITGSIATAGSYGSTISATNSLGTGSASLSWNVTAASLHAYPSVTPDTIFNGQSVHLNSDGTTNFGFGWTENVVWKPGGAGYDILGNAALGSYINYTPAAGIGTYWLQFRLVDQYYNYVDEWVSFTVTDVVLPPATVSVTGSSSYSVSLSWSGASAAAGINHYNVYRNGTLIGDTTGTTYTDSTALPGTTYSYTVKTVDNNSGLSAASDAASATTALSLEIFTPLP